MFISSSAFLKFIFVTTLLVGLQARAADEQIISDRPGDTDNPKTNDPGQFRIEAGIYNYTHDVSHGTRATTQKYGNVYLVGGVAKDMELQVAYDGFSQLQTTTDDGSRLVNRASGGETIRYKWNLVGNQEGRFALALLPRIEKTEGLDGEQWQGALGVPFAFDITEKLNISFTPEWRNETSDDGRRAHGAYSAVVLEYDINNLWGVFGQNSAHTQHIRDGWEVTAGFGATYKASSRLQIDVSTDFGLTGVTDNFNLQTGFTYVL